MDKRQQFEDALKDATDKWESVKCEELAPLNLLINEASSKSKAANKNLTDYELKYCGMIETAKMFDIPLPQYVEDRLRILKEDYDDASHKVSSLMFQGLAESQFCQNKFKSVYDNLMSAKLKLKWYNDTHPTAYEVIVKKQSEMRVVNLARKIRQANKIKQAVVIPVMAARRLMPKSEIVQAITMSGIPKFSMG
jgi:hypothetical protein